MTRARAIGQLLAPATRDREPEGEIVTAKPLALQNGNPQHRAAAAAQLLPQE
jgi:hypothetical protein